MEFSTLIGSLGVGLLLTAFFLNLFEILTHETKTYVTLNILGAALACYASFLIDYVPFVILEGTWAVVAAVGLVNILRKP